MDSGGGGCPRFATRQFASFFSSSHLVIPKIHNRHTPPGCTSVDPRLLRSFCSFCPLSFGPLISCTLYIGTCKRRQAPSSALPRRNWKPVAPVARPTCDDSASLESLFCCQQPSAKHFTTLCRFSPTAIFDPRITRRSTTVRVAPRLISSTRPCFFSPRWSSYITCSPTSAPDTSTTHCHPLYTFRRPIDQVSLSRSPVISSPALRRHPLLSPKDQTEITRASRLYPSS